MIARRGWPRYIEIIYLAREKARGTPDYEWRKCQLVMAMYGASLRTLHRYAKQHNTTKR